MISRLIISVSVACYSVLQVHGGLVVLPRAGFQNLGTSCVQQSCATTSTTSSSQTSTSSPSSTSILTSSSSVTDSSIGNIASSTELSTSQASAGIPSASAEIPSQASSTSSSQIDTLTQTTSSGSTFSSSDLAISTSLSLSAAISTPSSVLTSSASSSISVLYYGTNSSTSRQSNVSIFTSSDSSTTTSALFSASNMTYSALSTSYTSEATSTPLKGDSTSYPTIIATNITTLAIASTSLPLNTDSISTGWSNISTTTSEILYPLGCTVLSPGEIWTTYHMMRNTTTTFGTIILGISTTFTVTPEFTPPVRCSLITASSTTSSSSSTKSNIKNNFTTTSKTITAIITSKNGVTVLTTITPADYSYGETAEKVTVTSTPGGGKVGISIPPVSTTPKITVAIPLATSPQAVEAIYTSSISTEDVHAAPTVEFSQAPTVIPVTSIAPGEVTVIVSSTIIVVGDQSYSLPQGSSTQTITASNSDIYTVDASKVVGPSLTLSVPAITPVQSPAQSPVQPSPVTSIAPDGNTLVVSPSIIAIGDQSFSVPKGSSTQTITASNNIVYTIDASQVIGASLTINIPVTKAASQAAIIKATAQPTNLVILDPEPFSLIGDSIVVLGSSTITYGPKITYAPGVSSTTSIIHGEVITVGPKGVSYDGTTIGGALNPSGTKIGLVGGLSITEVGSTLAIINGVFLTIGPSASAFTTVINGHTIEAGLTGLVLGGTTLTDFNPSTVAITAGGITFSAIGQSLAVIEGTTYTYGSNAAQTTAVIDGKTVSFGPGGIGFASTTFVSYTPTAIPVIAGPTGTSSSSGTGSAGSDSSLASGAAAPNATDKKGSGVRIGPVNGVVLVLVVGFAYMI